MARVAQVGAVETSTAYNRSLSKIHRPVKAVSATADSFELGQEKPETKNVIILEVEPCLSAASYCLADKCAMWRWGGHVGKERGYCGLSGRPEVAA